ncbi:hypothetical protein [Alkalicoccus daliensis]|uniref:hypothetical protein n=1 Tax=Alkalicoccus daliensis TaxID=745820 RepID=UPI0015869867|nr:hypothetical protein [Alkalicoccus daliensis]
MAARNPDYSEGIAEGFLRGKRRKKEPQAYLSYINTCFNRAILKDMEGTGTAPAEAKES